MPVGDSSLGEVIGRHLQGHAIARQHSNSVPSEFAGEMCQNGSVLIQLDAEQPARKLFNDCACYFNAVFFTHSPLVIGVRAKGQLDARYAQV